jgi:hypothetical protein
MQPGPVTLRPILRTWPLQLALSGDRPGKVGTKTKLGRSNAGLI